ncbi:putative mediator of RNA polymerase II transcription subunit 26 [Anopheles cruzii]|uniref:putative mediator of RNA polymerase II transcription subunit 26 n=1 Tax=Anopheles cruzii TaxID=68878 RepID=UPI0022EC973C|nr:putative mediator of RNA polymerase II transcription subunit 26 [Anopheles cruzii]
MSIPRSEMRRSGGGIDPKERLRKEEGIVLSPQRRSFNMGCQMPSAPQPSGNLGLSGSLLRSDRDLLSGRERRIGSGRILSRDVSWDYRPDKELEAGEYRTNNNNGNNNGTNNANFRDGRDGGKDSRDLREGRATDAKEPGRERMERGGKEGSERDERFERRSGGYERPEKENPPPRGYGKSSRNNHANNDGPHRGEGGGYYGYNNYNHYGSNHGSSYGERRRYNHDHGRDEEPEWFSEPTSQHDTIELRGFDEPSPGNVQDSEQEKEPSASSKSLGKCSDNPAEERTERTTESTDKESVRGVEYATGGASDPHRKKQDRSPGDGESNNGGKGVPAPKVATADFNIEDILKLDDCDFLYSVEPTPVRLSPLPNGIPQRIPSPRELQYHTQSIMQHALIRKKLEEARENYRKRQEQQQQPPPPQQQQQQPQTQQQPQQQQPPQQQEQQQQQHHQHQQQHQQSQQQPQQQHQPQEQQMKGKVCNSQCFCRHIPSSSSFYLPINSIIRIQPHNIIRNNLPNCNSF